jgi:hypothetical protein
VKASFHPSARAELLAAVEWYESKAENLGNRFAAAIGAAIRFAQERPEAGSAYAGQWRRVSLREFPFAVIYRIAGDNLRIIAIAHHRRRPGLLAASPRIDS